MRGVLATERGGELYRQRQPLIEPVFGHTKYNRGFDRFHRRGRAAVRTEWRLITATHNLAQAPPATSTRPATDAGAPGAAGRGRRPRDFAGVYATASRERHVRARPRAGAAVA